MEPRFGADFSEVRLHTSSEAAQLNRAVGAQAFTHGPDIYLGGGKDDLELSAGKQLLAHELTHTIQQGAAGTLGLAAQREQLSYMGGGLVQRDEDDAIPAGAFDVPTLTSCTTPPCRPPGKQETGRMPPRNSTASTARTSIADWPN